MKAIKNKLLLGFLIFLTINTICSAEEVLKEIKSRLDTLENLLPTHIKLLQDARAMGIPRPPTDPKQLQDYLKDLSRPIGIKNYWEVALKGIHVLLINVPNYVNPEEVESCRMRMEDLLEKIRREEVHGIQERINTISENLYYQKLLGSELDILGLSRNITICQDVFCGSEFSAFFNFLRSRSS